MWALFVAVIAATGAHIFASSSQFVTFWCLFYSCYQVLLHYFDPHLSTNLPYNCYCVPLCFDIWQIIGKAPVTPLFYPFNACRSTTFQQAPCCWRCLPDPPVIFPQKTTARQPKIINLISPTSSTHGAGIALAQFIVICYQPITLSTHQGSKRQAHKPCQAHQAAPAVPDNGNGQPPVNL